MARSAKVLDLDVLKSFRLALLTFADKATSALGEADSDLQRVTTWLEHEQTSFWTSEMRKRHDAVMKAKEALRFKQIFKSPTGGRQSTVDEEKAVAVATRRFAEAEQKMVNVKKWIRQLHKEAHLYRGAVQRLATTVSTDVPNAGAKILRMLAALEGYVALSAGSTAGANHGDSAPTMTRPGALADVGIAYVALRSRAPAGALRDAAANGDPAAPWTSAGFAVGDEQRLDQLAAEREPLDPASIVVFTSDAPTARRVFLQRLAPAFPGDSGWFIGSVDIAPDAPAGKSLQSLRLNDLLGLRPHLAPVLALPRGTLAVFDSAGVAALLDEGDHDLWPTVAAK